MHGLQIRNRFEFIHTDNPNLSVTESKVVRQVLSKLIKSYSRELNDDSKCPFIKKRIGTLET